MFKDYNDIAELFEAHLAKADFSWLNNRSLQEAMAYSLSTPGKRIRPVIILKLGQLLAAEQSPLLAAGLAAEATHCSTLIHDDLPSLDDDDLRRGQATCHVRYGEAVAVLAGDALFSWAINLLLKEPSLSEDKRLKLANNLTEAYSLVCAGQVQDIESRKSANNSLEQLQLKNSLKTGALFKFCFEAPAIIAGKSETLIEELSSLAADFGMLFQITDDILDATSSKDALGKQTNKDKQLGTETYVSKLGVEGAYSEASQIVENISARVGEESKEFVNELSDSVLNRVKK